MIVNKLGSLVSDQKFRLTNITNVSDWQALIKSPEYNQERWIDESLFLTLPREFLGFCAVCESWQTLRFTGDHSSATANGGVCPAYTETSVCLNCQTNSRMRATVEILKALGACEKSDIYFTEQSTILFNEVKNRFSNLVGSEYLGNQVAKGQQNDKGYRNEDLQDLTFKDSRFDFVVSLDVLEHIPDPFKAMNEILRVLKPNGIGVITFPFFPDLNVSFKRAQLEMESDAVKINYLAPAVYHGDPLNKDGVLVFHDLGFDIIDYTKSISSEASLISYWCYRSGHFGFHRFVLIVQK